MANLVRIKLIKKYKAKSIFHYKKKYVLKHTKHFGKVAFYFFN